MQTQTLRAIWTADDPLADTSLCLAMERMLLSSGFFTVNFSCGVRASKLALVRLWFLKYAAVDIARPHHLLSSFASFSIALVALNRVLQACSTTPFCLGVWGIVISRLIPRLCHLHFQADFAFGMGKICDLHPIDCCFQFLDGLCSLVYPYRYKGRDPNFQ